MKYLKILAIVAALCLFAGLALAVVPMGQLPAGAVDSSFQLNPNISAMLGGIGSACTSAAGCTSGFCKCACKACTATADCPTGKTCSSGKCVSSSTTAKKKLNEPCALDADCETGLYCSLLKKCAAQKELNAQCVANNECKTGMCTSGKCAASVYFPIGQPIGGAPLIPVTGQLTLTLPPGYVPPSIITPPIVVGNLNVSQACTTNASCKSGLCKNSKCWCKVNADCATGMQCSVATGECTAPGLSVGVGIVSPIGGQQPIVLSGQGSIGSACTSNDACDSGLCSCSCASCTADADCGAGKTCQNGACTTSPASQAEAQQSKDTIYTMRLMQRLQKLSNMLNQLVTEGVFTQEEADAILQKVPKDSTPVEVAEIVRNDWTKFINALAGKGIITEEERTDYCTLGELDCPLCGNGECETGEDAASCQADCASSGFFNNFMKYFGFGTTGQSVREIGGKPGFIARLKALLRPTTTGAAIGDQSQDYDPAGAFGAAVLNSNINAIRQMDPNLAELEAGVCAQLKQNGLEENTVCHDGFFEASVEMEGAPCSPEMGLQCPAGFECSSFRCAVAPEGFWGNVWSNIASMFTGGSQ